MMQKMKTPKIGLAKYLLIFPVAFALMFLSTAATSAYFNVEEVAVVETVEVVQDDDVIVEIVKEIVQNDAPIFHTVEQMADFPGGRPAMFEWLRANMRYPVEAFQQGVQGDVFVEFVVEKDGSFSNIQVVRGVNPYLDAEAIRIFQAMPNWQPARQGGEIVRARFTMPVQFRLQ